MSERPSEIYGLMVPLENEQLRLLVGLAEIVVDADFDGARTMFLADA